MYISWKDSLQYTILPGKTDKQFQLPDLYEKAFAFWLNYWLQTCKETGMQKNTVVSDDFLRHEYVNVVTFKGEVIAMINCTRIDFNSESCRYHSYIKDYFCPEFVDKIRALKIGSALTMENIVSHKDWRSKKTGVSLGAIMLNLALLQSVEAGFEGAFGAARSDAPTAKISYELGARAIIHGMHFHGKPTDLVAWQAADIGSHPDSTIRDLVDDLWRKRQDLTNAMKSWLNKIA